MTEFRKDLMHELHAQAWEMWGRPDADGQTHEEVPDFSVLTYEEMNNLQYWDAPTLPSKAHDALLDAMDKRWDAADPCPTCGKKSPE